MRTNSLRGAAVQLLPPWLHVGPNLSLNADVPRAGASPRSGPPVSLFVRARPRWHGHQPTLAVAVEGLPQESSVPPNLLIHIVAMPLFLFGTITLLAAIAQRSLLLFAVAVGWVLVAVRYKAVATGWSPCHRNPSAGRLISYRGSSLSSGLRFRALSSRGVACSTAQGTRALTWRSTRTSRVRGFARAAGRRLA